MPSQKPLTNSSKSGSSETESFESIARRMLECALALHAEDRSLAAPDIQGCVKEVAEYAKSRGYHVEQLIIDLKQTWYGIADTGEHPKSEVTFPLVTLCIKEFYGAAPEPSGD